MTIQTILAGVPVIPVLSIQSVDEAVPLCRALCAGGLNVLEITLRTDCALAAIAAVIEQVPEAIVGAGTVTTAQQLQQVAALGAQFAVSPGATDALLAAAAQSSCPLLPGVSTVSEAMRAKDAGFTMLKLFPAEAVGGVNLLKSLQGPLPELTFCPTGGIKPNNQADYLALDNVICVGGTWLTPANLVATQQWAAITSLAQQACQG